MASAWPIAVVIVVLLLVTFAGAVAVIFRPNTAARAWFLRVVCRVETTAVQGRPERRFPNIEDIADDDDVDDENDSDAGSVIYVIDGVGYATQLAAPPPSYDEALAMKRAESGDIVRFVVGVGDDAIVFEFVMPKNLTNDGEVKVFIDFDDRCPPPMYCGHPESTHASLVEECESGNNDLVADQVASAPDDS